MKDKKVVLAYSGGLDTSVILCWLLNEMRSDVIAFVADVGQVGEDWDLIINKARTLGAIDVIVSDIKEEFVRDFVFPAVRANALYEGLYPLGTALARPVIAKAHSEIALEFEADAVAHGATGKGNDQVRFEISYAHFIPKLQVIAPWRIWEFRSREDLLDYAIKNGIDVSASNAIGPPYSIDSNVMHNSFEGRALEDPSQEPDYADMLIMTKVPEMANDVPEYVRIDFASGNPVSVNGRISGPFELLSELNVIGGRNGIGIVDLVENRYVGIKSRGVYETPGVTLLIYAHRVVESLTIDGGAMHLKDSLMPRYAELIYNGYWWSEERKMLQSAIDTSQHSVSGSVTLKLYRGSIVTVSRSSDHSLYSRSLASFSDDGSDYDRKDAAGFIRVSSLVTRLSSLRRGG